MTFTSPVASFEVAVTTALQSDKIALAPGQPQRLAKLIHYSLLARGRPVPRVVPPSREILALIESARGVGDVHEAVWRAFIGAHFARLSASTRDRSAESAARLLCAFGNEPVWTWAHVSANRGKDLKAWLTETHEVLSLTFGNHRSHELPRNVDLWLTIRSFTQLAIGMNGPANVVKAPGASNAGERFDILFRKLSKIHRFGRLGSFDFIDLLLQMKLVTDAEPAHCYLKGSTGPLKGAQQIWGSKPVEILDDCAAKLAKTLDVSCFVLEDALCNFQKSGHKTCCGEPGEPDEDGNCGVG